MEIEKIDIYIDLKNLHKILYKAQTTMTKADRIIMGNRLLDLNEECISWLSMAINSPRDSEDRLDYIFKLLGRFDALRLDLETAADLRMFKESRPTVDRLNGKSQKVESIVISMFKLLGKIDKGVGQWRSVTKARIVAKKTKDKTASESNGQT